MSSIQSPERGITVFGMTERGAGGKSSAVGPAWRRWHWSGLAAVGAAIAGIVLSALAAMVIYDAAARLLRSDFDNRASSEFDLLQARIDNYLGEMTTVRTLFDASATPIARGEFEPFAQGLLDQQSAIRNLSWVPRIRGDERAAHEAAAAQGGLAGYRISDLRPDGSLAPAAQRDEFFPVSYTTASPVIALRYGLDLGLRRAPRQALDEARDHDQMAAWPLSETVGGEEGAVMVALPVYAQGLPHTTLDQRRRNLIGFITSAIRVYAMADAVFGPMKAPIDEYLFAPDSSRGAPPLYGHVFISGNRSNMVVSLAALSAGVHWTGALRIPGSGGRRDAGALRWLAVMVPEAGGILDPGHHTGWIVFVFGLIVSLTLPAYLWNSARHARRLRGALTDLGQRDRILDAIAVSSAKLVTGRSLDIALPEALEVVARAVAVDRLLVLESGAHLPGGGGLALRYQWQAPEVPLRLDRGFFATLPPNPPELSAWLMPLREGRAVTAVISQAAGAVRRLLEGLGIRSLLLVPITVEGKYWGHVGLDDCRTERIWNLAEIDLLKTLAELIGASTARQRFVEALADADRIVQNSPTVLYRLGGDRSLPLTYVSSNVGRVFGYDVARFLDPPDFYRSTVHPEDRAKIAENLNQLLDGSADAISFELRARVADGSYRWLENRATAVHDAAGRCCGVEGLLIDMTERKAGEERVAALARTDTMTGLANRAAFLDRLRQAFAATRRGARPFSVLYLDLDHFKNVNDSLGHPAGDALLSTVAARLRANIRETDLAARFGGDEFAILQADMTDLSTAGTLAQKLRDELAAPYDIEGREVRVSASIGIAAFTPETAGPEEMLAQADRALYRAKEEGRDRYCFHSAQIDSQVHQHLALADELRRAVAHDEFELHYQPQVAVASGEIVGMEALLRWRQPAGGLLAPGAFLPAAEKTGLMLAIGRWVLDNACGQIERWRRQGLTPPVVAINLSASQLRFGREFARDVASALRRSGLSPDDIEFDLSEAVLQEITRTNPGALEELEKIGVGIAIDDFGSDYISIGGLNARQVRRFKIAPQFIGAMTHSPADASVVRAIVNLARQLGIDVIAEGVETEEQRDFLSATMADAAAQGFYFSRPVPAAEAGEVLRRGSLRKPATAELAGA